MKSIFQTTKWYTNIYTNKFLFFLKIIINQKLLLKVNDFDMQTCFQILYSFNFPCVKNETRIKKKWNSLRYNLKEFVEE